MDQQRYTQKSLDRDSLPVTKTLLHLEIHASTVYTHALFYEFQKQCVSSLNSCSAGNSSRDSTTRFLDVEDAILRTTYTVAFNPTTFDAKCSCKMFERKGYICKHIIWILSEFYSTLSLIKSLPENHVTELTDLLKAFRQKFKPDPETMTKQQELEILLGVKCSDEVHILPPVKSKNKGSGKRLTSKKQMSIEKAQKPKRFCNNCKQIAHHDKRNYPNPAAETSEHSGDDNKSDTSSLADVD
ncbi:protein FAR1-RELATED SEQUENCE 7-like [Silene latifolia]|uniref:protein FAR1-RELATED SEQUENCE 7-like n=1 Tax=Silene latifolia TaxID=37657 RepID=UPI003D780F5B